MYFNNNSLYDSLISEEEKIKNLSLESDHLLLSDVVSNVAGVKSLRKPALAEEHSVDSGGVGGEPSTGLLLNSGLSSGMGLKTGESGDSNSLVGPDDRLLGCDHIGGSGHIGDCKEASGGIAVGIVGAGRCGESSRQLGCSEGRSHEGENHEGSHFVKIRGFSQSFSGIYCQTATPSCLPVPRGFCLR